MRRLEVGVHVRTHADPATVWQLLADVRTWPDWSGFDEADYEAPTVPDLHGVGAVRLLRAGRLRARDTVLAFEPAKRLSYSYVGSLPVTDHRADVTLVGQGSGTLITWQAAFAPKFPLTGGLLRMVMRKVLTDVSSALAAASESRCSSGGRSRHDESRRAGELAALGGQQDLAQDGRSSRPITVAQLGQDDLVRLEDGSERPAGERLALTGQLDEHAAAVAGIRVARDVLRALEPVQSGGHRAAGDHAVAGQHRGIGALRTADPEQRGQDVEVGV